jgi:hypothetical protein
MSIVQSYLRRAPIMCNLMNLIVHRARQEECRSIQELQERLGEREFERQFISTLNTQNLSAQELHFLITRLSVLWLDRTIMEILVEDTEDEEDMFYDEQMIYERLFRQFFQENHACLVELFDHFFEMSSENLQQE